MIAKIAHHLSNPQTTTTMPIIVSTYNDTDTVTIAEARARIGTGSPDRHMFHHAVTRGDLTKSADSGPRCVKFRWGDVRAMHERGDFSKKQERGGTTSGDQTAPEVPSEDADTAVVSATDDPPATDVSDATTHKPDDILTIAEIRQRIGGTYPTRQSVHDAIKRGDLKATPNGADKKVRLLWGEVEKFMAGGGFSKRRQQSTGTATVHSGAAPEDDLSPPAVTEPAPPDDADALDAVSVTYPAPGCECEPRPSTIVDACADPGNPGNADAAAMANSAANADDDMATAATAEDADCGLMVVVADPEAAAPPSADVTIDPEVANEIAGVETMLSNLATLTDADRLASLQKYARGAEGLSRLAVTTGNRAVVHAWGCGKLLIDAKARCGHGNYIPWLEENVLPLGGSKVTCQRYMRLARKFPDIRKLVGSHPSLNEAYHACGILKEKKPAAASTAPGAGNASNPRTAATPKQALLAGVSALQGLLRRFCESDECLTEDELNQFTLAMGELNRFHSQLHDADAQTQTRTAA